LKVLRHAEQQNVAEPSSVFFVRFLIVDAAQEGQFMDFGVSFTFFLSKRILEVELCAKTLFQF
jgi:hypothetical protein